MKLEKKYARWSFDRRPDGTIMISSRELDNETLEIRLVPCSLVYIGKDQKMYTRRIAGQARGLSVEAAQHAIELMERL